MSVRINQTKKSIDALNEKIQMKRMSRPQNVSEENVEVENQCRLHASQPHTITVTPSHQHDKLLQLSPSLARQHSSPTIGFR